VKSFLLAALFVFTTAAAPAQILEAPEHFRAEDNAVPNPATLPDPAMQILLKDDTVRRVLGKSAHINPKWLLVSKIQLAGSEEDDYIAMGRGPLGGATIASFWVFRVRGKSFDLVLHLSAHDLILRTTATHGLRDLEAVNINVNTITIADFAFDGARYQPHRSKTEKIK
jgi:hypothetical protein